MEKEKKKTIATRPDKEVYIIGDRCYKVFESEKDKADVLNEALNQARVEETGLSIPSLLEVGIVDGEWAIVTRYISGKTLEEMLDEEPEKEDEYLKFFVDLQIEMQSKRCPLLNKHRDKMNRKVSETDLSATLRYDLHRRIERMPRHNCLCHGDYNPSNVIIDEEGTPYIIDWSHATQGNAEADAARTYMMFLIEGNKVRARKYIDLFAKQTGCQISDILAWLPILAASQSVKGIRKQSEFLRNLIFMNRKQLEELYEGL